MKMWQIWGLMLVVSRGTTEAGKQKGRGPAGVKAKWFINENRPCNLHGLFGKSNS